MMALLFRREVFVEYAQPGVAGPAKSYDNWMGIYASSDTVESNRIGFVHSVSSPVTRNGVEGAMIAVTAELATNMLSIPTEILVTGTAWNPVRGGLAEFDFKIRSFDHTMRILGKTADGRLSLEFQTAGESFPLEFPMGGDLLLSGGMGTTTLNLPALEVGDEVVIDSFDPLTLTKGRAHVKCVGRETIEAAGEWFDTKVLTTSLSGVTSKFWVTDSEETIRIETPFGFTFLKISQEEAMRPLEGRDNTREILDMLAVRPEGKRPFRGAKTMKLRIFGLPPGVSPPSDNIQRKEPGGIYVISMGVAPDSTDALGILLDDPEEFLDGDPFVQAGHPRIVEQVRQIVGDGDEPWEVAMRLYDWVYESIEKTIVLSFPSALEVLTTRKGDCNEHTVLYTALSRTAGVPTRIAIGIVWSEELEGFYYHAWPEVFVDRWIGIDPTLGQPLADATHLKLLTGSVEAWPKLVPFLGQIRLEILEIQ